MGKSKDGNVTCFMYTQMRIFGLAANCLAANHRNSGRKSSIQAAGSSPMILSSCAVGKKLSRYSAGIPVRRPLALNRQRTQETEDGQEDHGLQQCQPRYPHRTALSQRQGAL